MPNPTKAEYTFFSNVPGTVTKVNHVLDCEINLSKFQKSENLQGMFSAIMN